MKSCLTLSVFLVALAFALIAGAISLHEASPVTTAQRQAALAYQQQRDAQDLAECQRQADQWADLTNTVMPVVKLSAGLLIALTPLALLALAPGAGF